MLVELGVEVVDGQVRGAGVRRVGCGCGGGRFDALGGGGALGFFEEVLGPFEVAEGGGFFAVEGAEGGAWVELVGLEGGGAFEVVEGGEGAGLQEFEGGDFAGCDVGGGVEGVVAEFGGGAEEVLGEGGMGFGPLALGFEDGAQGAPAVEEGIGALEGAAEGAGGLGGFTGEAGEEFLGGEASVVGPAMLGAFGGEGAEGLFLELAAVDAEGADDDLLEEPVFLGVGWIVAGAPGIEAIGEEVGRGFDLGGEAGRDFGIHGLDSGPGARGGVVLLGTIEGGRGIVLGKHLGRGGLRRAMLSLHLGSAFPRNCG